MGIIHAGKLLLEGPTAELVDRFRTIDCIAQDSLAPKTIPGIRVLHREGERWRLLADLRHDTLQSLESMGAREIVAMPVTLEELFLALIRSGGHAADHS